MQVRRIGVVTRDVLRAECAWLDKDVKRGTLVYEFRGPTYGCISPSGVAISFSSEDRVLEDGSTLPPEFCELPRDSILWE